MVYFVFFMCYFFLPVNVWIFQGLFQGLIIWRLRSTNGIITTFKREEIMGEPEGDAQAKKEWEQARHQKGGGTETKTQRETELDR